MTNSTQQPTWLDRNEYPFEAKYLTVSGQQMHYIDEGKGPVILFVHGTPSWSFDYREVIKALRGQFRCIAFDHIGFGLSDKPKDYPYSTQGHAENLASLVAQLQLEKFSLVLHDFGGPIGFDFALKNPARIEHIVALNTWLGSSRDQPEYQKLAKILKSPLVPFLYKYLNFSARFLLPQSFGDRKKLSKSLHRQYYKPFGKVSERLGCLAFAKSLLHDQDWFEAQWQQRATLAAIPFLLIWGMKDSFVGAAYLKKLQMGLPNTKSVELPTVGHFPQEEAASEVATHIRQFLQGV